jgi:hypothetical protein
MFQKSKFILLSFLIFSFSNTYSQKIEFGLGGGISHFKGDISPNFNPLQIGIGVNGLFRYNLSRSVSLRGQILFTGYNVTDEKVNDPFYNSRLGVAKGNILEGAAIAEYNFLDKGKMVKNQDWTPYLFGGIGFASIRNKSDIFSSPKKISTPVIPYGVGIKYRFKGPLSVCAEFGTRYTNSDEIDLIYSQFLGKINTPAADAQNSRYQYGNLTRKDQYYFTNITLTYTIFNLICPE